MGVSYHLKDSGGVQVRVKWSGENVPVVNQPAPSEFV
jgi:hypothetical protein